MTKDSGQQTTDNFHPSSFVIHHSYRPYLIALLVSVLMCITIWAAVFYATGDRLECSFGSTSFCAHRTRVGSGMSIQWGERQPISIWYWGPQGCCNRRLWPPEAAGERPE